MRVGYRMRMLIVQELNLRSWRYILQDQGNMISFNFLNTHIACKRLSSDDNGLRFLKSQDAKECLRAFEISHDDRKMIKMPQHGVSLLNFIKKSTLWQKRTSAYAFVLAMSNVVHSSAVYRQHLCRDPARLRHAAGKIQLHYLPPAGCCWVAPSRGRLVNGR